MMGFLTSGAVRRAGVVFKDVTPVPDPPRTWWLDALTSKAIDPATQDAADAKIIGGPVMATWSKEQLATTEVQLRGDHVPALLGMRDRTKVDGILWFRHDPTVPVLTYRRDTGVTA